MEAAFFRVTGARGRDGRDDYHRQRVMVGMDSSLPALLPAVVTACSRMSCSLILPKQGVHATALSSSRIFWITER